MYSIFFKKNDVTSNVTKSQTDPRFHQKYPVPRSMICRAIILSLSLAHLLLVTTMALLENRVLVATEVVPCGAPAFARA